MTIDPEKFYLLEVVDGTSATIKGEFLKKPEADRAKSDAFRILRGPGQFLVLKGSDLVLQEKKGLKLVAHAVVFGEMTEDEIMAYIDELDEAVLAELDEAVAHDNSTELRHLVSIFESASMAMKRGGEHSEIATQVHKIVAPYIKKVIKSGSMNKATIKRLEEYL